jgi:hypothetical protein
MPWPLQFQASPPAPADRRAGMYWFGKNEIAPSPNFITDWRGKRPQIVIVCPDGTLWCPDQCPSWGSNTDTGWKVTGELPAISATPSIGKPGYHGWLKDGALSDDLDGRTFPATAKESP